MKRNQSKDAPAFVWGRSPSSHHSPPSRNPLLGLRGILSEEREKETGNAGSGKRALWRDGNVAPYACRGKCRTRTGALLLLHLAALFGQLSWLTKRNCKKTKTKGAYREAATQSAGVGEGCTVPSGTARPGRCVE
ncbi:hypothetical protein Q8A73_016887 [Channa argus]|nr:hypothetical protein Q8A73_016887 [Channa argus]